MRFRSFILSLLAVALCCCVAPSCSKELIPVDPPEEEEDTPSDNPTDDRTQVAQPGQYEALYNAYLSGDLYTGCNFGDSYAVLSFKSGYKFTLDYDQIRVYIHQTIKVPDLTVSDDGYWMIGTEKTAILNETDVDDADAIPVYTWIDGDTLHVQLSNGNMLVFPYVETPKEFTMPKMYIKTDGNKPINSLTTYLTGTYRLVDADKHYSDVEEVSGTMQIRGRGNSTWDMPKKPYRMKLDEDTHLLDMPSNKDWVLLAEYSDKSLLRNQVAMEISRICDMPWTPEMRSIELVVNGVYKGVYTLCQKPEVSKKKVNIDVEAGDCYLEVDARYDGSTYFNSNRYSVPIVFRDPEVPSDELLASIKDKFAKFELSISSQSTESCEKYVDIETFVDYFIVNELTKNVDGAIYLSTFMTVPAGGKITMYHVWDFDLALGNCDYLGDCGPTGWHIKNCNWYSRFFNFSVFTSALKEKWNAIYPELQEIPDYIDFQVTEMGEAPARNFKQWNILNTYVWPNYKIPGSYEGEIDYLKDFYTQRLEWLNKQMQSL